jgi:hypothetical protein
MYRLGTRYPAAPGDPIPAGMDIWRDGDPSNAIANEPVDSPGDVRIGSGDVARYNSDAILNAQAVVGLMKGAPNVSSMIAQLPTSQLIEKVPTGAKLAHDANNVATPPVVLDAWGNPIIFVPSGGLGGVTMANQPGTYIVTSGGMIRVGDPLRPAVRPFFASAGPDGDFSKGDDNLYSFQD